MTLNEEIKQTGDEIFHVLEVIATIKDQLARAKARCAADKLYADYDWFHCATRALRHHQLDYQKLMAKQADLRQQRRTENIETSRRTGESFERTFMLCAKNILTTTVYAEIIEQTRLLCGETV